MHLTGLELALFYLLAANAGSVVSREELVEYLWGANYLATSNMLERHIRNLRGKLKNNSRRPRYILTKRGVGYTFMRGARPQAGQ